MNRILSTALLLMLALPAGAATIRLSGYDAKGRALDARGLLRHIAPARHQKRGVPPDRAGFYLADLGGHPVPGAPWWDQRSKTPALNWEGAKSVTLSMPWPIQDDGFSTVLLDGGGNGYVDGQKILLNEEIALSAYRAMRTSLKNRREAWKPLYRPTKNVRRLLEKAKKAITKAKAAREPRQKAKRFDKALTGVAFAWQQILYEHGRQIALDPALGRHLRYGLSLDETLLGRLAEHDRIADALKDSGANWVRLVFGVPPGDFTFSSEASFSVYDSFVDKLNQRGIKIMGSVLDSMLWPKQLLSKTYARRAANLARRYRGRISSWEVASEPNADWLGGSEKPISRQQVLFCVQKGIVALKRVDRAIETVATLHWWEGTARKQSHALLPWLDWAAARGFGRGIDVIALSVYPHRHPMGIAFDRVFAELHDRFPDKQLMLGGFSFADENELKGYWWLEPGGVKDARKDLLVLYMGIGAAVPSGLGGGFYWPTLQNMLPPKSRPTALFQLHRRTMSRLRQDRAKNRPKKPKKKSQEKK